MRFSAPRSLSPSPVRKQVSSLLPTHVILNVSNRARIKSSKKHPKQPHAPVTPPRRHTSTFGLNSDDEDEYDIDEDYSSDSYDTKSGSDVDSVPSSDSDSDSFCYGSESEVPPPPPYVYSYFFCACLVHLTFSCAVSLTQRLSSSRTSKEQRYVEDTISAIRLRARHYDPYEEWEKEMRRESLVRIHDTSTPVYTHGTSLADCTERTRLITIEVTCHPRGTPG